MPISPLRPRAQLLERNTFGPPDLKEFRMSRLFNKCREASEWNSHPWQGGVAAPIKKKRRSLLSGRRRGGSFQPPIYRKLTEPPRPRFAKERGHLLDGADTPP